MPVVTFAQAQERAEDWINAELPAYQHRDVRVREFGRGFVVWAEDRPEGPRSDGGGQRLVIARDSGDVTLWPALPVGEVIRRYEEEYGTAAAAPAAPPPARVDLNQTSFLLTPPEWLQEAADRMGVSGSQPVLGGQPQAASGPAAADAPAASAPPGDTSGGGTGSGFPGTGAATGSPGDTGDPGGSLPGSAAPHSDPEPAAAPVSPGPSPSPAPPAAAAPSTPDDSQAPLPADSAPTAPFAAPSSATPSSPLPAPAAASAAKDPDPASGTGEVDWPAPGGQDPADPPGGGAQEPTPWAGTDTNADQGEDRSVPLPATVFAPPLALDEPGSPPTATPEAKTALMSGGSQLPPTAVAPVLPGSEGPAPAPHSYGYPGAPAAGGAGTPPTPPPVPGTGTPPPAAPGAGDGTGGYIPTQLVASLGGQNPLDPAAQPAGPGTPPPPGGVHQAATMLASPTGPGAPPPPNAPGAPGAPGAGAGRGSTPPGPPTPPPNVPGAPGGTPPPGGVHHAATMLASPGGPGTPPPPSLPNAPGAPGAPGTPPPGDVHHAATMLASPGGPGTPPPPSLPNGPGTPPPPASYGYPQQPTGLPTVGPGYQAVLRYRAQDGSEQQLIRRSAPGIPHPEWQIFHELQAMGVPPQQVLELHTELESCELPGAYCARMIREQWPQARITSIAPYGTDHASRQQGMGQLLAHQGELHQVADAPPRLAPVRAPLPQVQAAPPLRPEDLAQELAAAFGPGVFRFEQRAVARQGVPEAVAVTLMWAGLPVDVGPFFWAQAQPGRPVPTLAEVAQERGVQPAQDAGSYLVVGSDFGRAMCVQYGTAHIVAVPVEAGPGGAPAAPQFVNTGLPEFARCLALLGRMWRLRFGLNQEQAGRWTVDFQAQLAALDPAALASPENWWSVLLEQMWDGLL